MDHPKFDEFRELFTYENANKNAYRVADTVVEALIAGWAAFETELLDNTKAVLKTVA